MASGSGKDQYTNWVDLPREESKAAAAAAAAAEPTLPVPPSNRFQERIHGAPEAGDQNPCAAAVVEAATAKRKAKKTVGPSRRGSAGGKSPLSPHEESNAAAAEPTLPGPPSDRFHGAPEAGSQNPCEATVVEAAAAKRKAKKTVVPPRRGSAGARPPLSRRAASVSSSRELSSAGVKSPSRAARCFTRRWWRGLTGRGGRGTSKAVEHRNEADESPSQDMDQVMSPTMWHGKVYKKSLWRKFLGRIGKPSGNYATVTPHVSYQTVHMSGIIKHYNLIEKVAGRLDSGSNALNFYCNYTEFIPVHGDGECFYRSFILSYLEQVLHRQDTHEEHRLLAVVEGVARQHACLGWTSEFSRSHKAFKKLIKKVIRWKARSRGKHGPTNSYGQEKLLEFFSSYDRSNEIFTFLRLVASIWIFSHREEFKLHISELSEGYSLINCCFDEVIHHKVFTNYVQITAIVRALGVPLQAEYHFQEAGQGLYTGQDSQIDIPRSTCWPCHHHQQPPNHVPLMTLLYTNGHYDILYPDKLCSQQIAQFNKSRDKAKAVQALVPASVRNGSCASAMGAIVRLGWLVFVSACNSVLSWITGYCFGKRQRPQAPSPEFSWLSIMGSPIINSDSSCTISACTMCIEAQHRLAFERLNGRGSFTFKAKVPAELKKTCYKAGVWSCENGASIEEVLLVIAAKGGVITQRVPNNIKLPIDGFFAINMDDIGGYQMMRIIYAHGPIIGSLWAANGYYDNTTGDDVYRRVREDLRTPKNGDHHCVVCFGYKLDKEAGELLIHIMDNHTDDGPLRWIEFSAFDYFYVPVVTPIELHQLRRKKRKENHSIQASVTRCLSVWEKKVMVWLIGREIDRYYRHPRVKMLCSASHTRDGNEKEVAKAAQVRDNRGGKVQVHLPWTPSGRFG